MSPPAQNISFSRLLLVVSGSVGAAYLPPWLVWLAQKHEDLELRVVLTKSAERFVTKTTIHASSGACVESDVWSDPGSDADTLEAPHVRWADWADAILVYPASMHYLARLAGGLADTPSLLAIHCASAPLVVAPGLPPGAVQGAVYSEHVRSLRERRGVDVIAPINGVSVTTGQKGVAASAWFPDAVACLEKLYRSKAVGEPSGAEVKEFAADLPST